MCSFIFSNKKLQNEKLNFISSKRGPDYTNVASVGQFNMIHNLLDISETRTLQPIIQDDTTLLFNGEIYNQHLECDTLSIIPLYKEYGENFIEQLNGEYAIVILDKNTIYLYSDIFATKPLFYCVENNNIGIATYASELKLLGFDKPLRVKSSSYIKINLNDYSIKEYSHSKFNLDEYKTSYDDCIKALENSIALRCNKKCAVGLSSGYDSGAILQWSLLNNETKNSFYYITNNRENETVMFDRFKKCKDNNLQYHIIDYYKNAGINNVMEFKVLLKYMEDFENHNNNDASSIRMLSRLMTTIKRDGLNIFISGQGGDEITSNYVKNTSFFYDLKHQFPWNNFYEGKNRMYIDQLEYVGGVYGIEVRYPFLDKFFVQEFLNLSHSLKTEKYKSVIREYLGDLSTNIKKVGLSCSKYRVSYK